MLLQTGQLISSVGSQCTVIAYPLVTLAITHSSAKAGFVGFMDLAPVALFLLLAGVAADRWNRKRMMIVTSVVRMLAISSLVIALVLGDLTFVQLPIVAFIESTASAFFSVASSGALRSVVSAEQLGGAAGAEQARIAAVRLAGPPIGGALFGVARLLPFLVDAVSYVVSFVTLFLIRTPFQEKRERDRSPLHSQIAEGFRFLWGQPFLRTTALIFSLGNLVSPASLLLAVIVIGTRQGLSSGAIGVLNAVFGATLLAGAFVAGYVTRRLSMRAILVTELWSSCTCAVFLLHPSVYVLLAGTLPQSFVIPSTDTALTAYRFRVTPDRLLGRVIAVSRNIGLAIAPLGPLAIGVLLETISERETVAIFAAVALSLALWGTLSPSLRNAPGIHSTPVEL
jgi:MFS family permease